MHVATRNSPNILQQLPCTKQAICSLKATPQLAHEDAFELPSAALKLLRDPYPCFYAHPVIKPRPLEVKKGEKQGK